MATGPANENPDAGRIPQPDSQQELLASEPSEDGRQTSSYQQATRGADGRYAMIYAANGRTIRVNLNRLRGPLNAYWFNPRSGQ